MRITFTLILILIAATGLLSQQAPDSTKKYISQRTPVPPKIDGKTDDAVWQTVPAQSDFVMSRPIEGGIPSQKTEFKILYDNTAIYVAAKMYDSAPDSILHELGLRDGRDPNSNSNATDINADLFRFVIDPYNNRQDAFDFGVYASGVQADSKFTDSKWDGVWESAVHFGSDGWSVEMKIPFSAIRFPKKEVQAWALQVTRYIRRNREFDQWCLTPSTAYNAQLYWGTLNGISNVDPPLRLSLSPYVSTYIERSPVFENNGSFTYNNGFTYNAGADVKYGIDERYTIDMTLLPDFGQVQSDNKIKTLGFEEITYNENRLFFKEGTDLFSKADLFYSRRIGKIPQGFFGIDSQLQDGETVKKNPSQVKLLNATKLSGRTDGGLGLGFFNAVTDNMYAEIEDSKGNKRNVLTEPLTNFNVIVFEQQVGNSSGFYFINTSVLRAKDYDDANVSGTGFTFTTKKNTYAVDGQFNLSQRFSKVAEAHKTYSDLIGYRSFAGVRKISGRFQAGVSHKIVSDTYNQNDLGYYITNNRQRFQAYASYFQFQPSKLFREGNIELSSNYSTDYINKERTDFQVDFGSWANLLSYNSIFGGGGFTPVVSRDYDPRLNGKFIKTHRYWYSYFGISSDYRKRLAIDITQNVSNFIDHLVSEGYNTDLSVRFRMNDKLTFNYSLGFYFDPYNFGFVAYDDDNRIVYGARKLYTYVNRVAVRYIFKTDMSASVAARHYWLTGRYRNYYYLDDEGNYPDFPDYNGQNNFSYNAFNIDFLYSWRFAPGSTLTVAYKNAIEYDGPFVTQDYGKNLKDTWNLPQTNSFSIKLLYYLDYASLKRKS